MTEEQTKTPEGLDDWDDEEFDEEAFEAQNATTLSQLRLKHKRIRYWNVPEIGLVVAARPKSKKDYQVFINQMAMDESDKAVALESFARKCVVHPSDPEDIKHIFDENPAFASTVSNAVSQLCGQGIRELGKGSTKRVRTS